MGLHPKKKILYVITKSNFGGAQRYVYELATGLPSEHYEVVVAFGGNGLLKTKLENAGIRTHTIQSFERDINLRKELQSISELSTLFRTERPDIVHLSSSKAGGSGALVARLCGVERIVFTAHGWPFYEPRGLIWRTLAWVFSYITTLLAHAVIVVSAHDRDGARMPGMRSKIHLVHTALPPITFETREDARATLFPTHVIQTHADDLWLVSTGEHTRNKNLDILIEALALLTARGHKNIFLTLMGEGELTEQIRSRVALHGLDAYVYFTGFVPEARMFLKAFDVFVLPSKKEGFPYGLLEAGAAGLSVVASNVGGIPELIHDRETGLLMNPHNVHSLVDALELLIKETKLRHDMQNSLSHIVHTNYALPYMLKETQAIYDPNGSSTA